MADANNEILAIESDRSLPRPDGGITHVYNCVALFQNNIQRKLMELFDLLENGRLRTFLQSDIPLVFFGSGSGELGDRTFGQDSMTDQIKRKTLGQFSEEMSQGGAIIKCIELEIIGIVSLDLFLQFNCTVPFMDWGLKPEEEKEEGHLLDGINPHCMFQSSASLENEKSPCIEYHPLLPTVTLSSILEDTRSWRMDPNRTTRTVFICFRKQTRPIFS